MLRKGSTLPQTHLNIVFNAGGAGDDIARLPAVYYIWKTFPHVTIHLWLKDYAVPLAKNMLPKHGRLRIYSVDQKHLYNKNYPAKVLDNEYHSNLSYNMTRHAFNCTVDQEVEPNDMNFLKLNTEVIDIEKFNLPEKYVAITSLYTAVVREMLPETINKITEYVISKGHVPVFLGKKETYAGQGVDVIYGYGGKGVNYERGLDLRGQTSLLEAGKILAKAEAVVGLDNGLLMLASCSDVAIVGGFTTVKPEHRMAYRNCIKGWNYFPVVPDESVECRFCQSQFQYVFDHDFRTCFYKEQGLDKEIQCVKNLTADKYIAELEKILL